MFRILLATLLFIVSCTVEAGPAVIYNGDFVKALKSNLKLKDEARIITGSVDPTVSAVDAEAGSLYIRDNGIIYVKKDAGSSTNWQDVKDGLVDLSSDVTGTLPIANGGTNSSTALSGNRLIYSSGGGLVEYAGITANRALATNGTGLPVASATTDTELGYVSGVTSSIQTQLNAKLEVESDTLQTVFDRGQQITIADGDNQLMKIVNSDTTNDTRSLEITSEAANSALYINKITEAGDGIRIDQSTADEALLINHTSNGNSVLVNKSGANGGGLKIDGSNASNSFQLTEIENSGTGASLLLDNQGGGLGLSTITTTGIRSGVSSVHGGDGKAGEFLVTNATGTQAGVRIKHSNPAGPTLSLAGSTAGELGIKPPASFTDYTLTLPTDDGTPSQFLQTDGSGVTTWATALEEVVQDTTPQLGGNLDLNGNDVNDGADYIIKRNTGTNTDSFYLVGAGGNSETGLGGNFGLGTQSLDSITSGAFNIGFGKDTLQSASTGDFNVAIGNNTANAVTSGDNNVTIGRLAGQTLSTGDDNVLIGYDADVSAAATASSVAVGVGAVAGTESISLGAFATNTESNTLQIGAPNGSFAAITKTQFGNQSMDLQLADNSTSDGIKSGSLTVSASDKTNAGATGDGGDLILNGGDAAGTVSGDGGNIRLTPGSSVATGSVGWTEIQSFVEFGTGHAFDNTGDILGGKSNTLTGSVSSTELNVISGGSSNSITGSRNSAILGGYQNTISDSNAVFSLGRNLNTNLTYQSVNIGSYNTLTDFKSILLGHGGASDGSEKFIVALDNTNTPSTEHNVLSLTKTGILDVGNYVDQSSIAGSDPQIRLHTNNASSQSNYIALKAPGTISASTTFTLPTADGDPGDVLSTDGAGQLDWSAPGGSVITGWTSFTPNWTNGGTTGTEEWRWRRVGESMEIQGQTPWTGAGAAAILNFTIPDGKSSLLSAVSSQYQGQIGNGGFYDISAGSRAGMRVYLNDITSISFVTDVFQAVNGDELGSGDVLTATMRIPISEWTGSGTLNVGGNQVQYASNNGTFDASGGGTTVYGPSGSQMGPLTAWRYKDVTFTQDIDEGDKVTLEFSDDRVIWAEAQQADINNTYVTNLIANSGSANDSSGVFWKKISANTVRIQWNRYQTINNNETVLTPWATGTYWRVVLHKNQQVVAYGSADTTNSGLIEFSSTSVNQTSTGHIPTINTTFEFIKDQYRVTMCWPEFTAGTTTTSGFIYFAGLVPVDYRPTNATFYQTVNTVEGAVSKIGGFYSSHVNGDLRFGAVSVSDTFNGTTTNGVRGGCATWYRY
jgi:hypothetical protein